MCSLLPSMKVCNSQKQLLRKAFHLMWMVVRVIYVLWSQCDSLMRRKFPASDLAVGLRSKQITVQLSNLSSYIKSYGPTVGEDAGVSCLLAFFFFFFKVGRVRVGSVLPLFLIPRGYGLVINLSGQEESLFTPQLY